MGRSWDAEPARTRHSRDRTPLAPSPLQVPCGGLEVLDPRLGINATNNPCSGFTTGVGTGTTNQISDGYFFFHHTGSDTVDRVDPLQLNALSASLAVWAVSVRRVWRRGMVG